MSQHRSLKGTSKITSKRNVLKRFERVNLLQARGQWKEGDRIHTIVTGRPVNCAGKAMPKAQPTVTMATADDFNSMFEGSFAGLLG